MEKEIDCILCDYNAEVESISPLDKNFQFDCPNCGTYYVDKPFKDCDKSDIPLYLLSGFALEQSKYGGMKKIAITLDGYRNILKAHYMPQTKEERFEQLMLYYYREIGNDLKHVVKVNSYPAICYSYDVKELEGLFTEAIDKKYLTFVDNENGFVQVTYEGAQFCETVREKRLKLNTDNEKEADSIQSNIWSMIHIDVSSVAKKLMLDGHYEQAIAASVKLLENRVKDICKEKTGQEISGTPLMQKVFKPKDGILKFEDITSQSGMNLQDGYRNIFAGVQLGIRNPYSHDSDRNPSEYEALHIIVMISHLMNMVDKAVEYTNSIE